MAPASQAALAALQSARGSLARGDAAAAREACRRILESFPGEPGALHLLGLIDYGDGDRVAAEVSLRRAAEAPEAAALYLLSYAELCGKFRDPAGALAMTRRALTLDAGSPLGWLSLGTQLIDTREYAEARSCFERALLLDPASWLARAQLAALLARTGDLAEADRCFEQLLRDGPGNPDAIALHAAYLQDLGRHQDALAEIERAIAQAPDCLDHRLRAAEIEMQCDRVTAALHRIESLGPRWAGDPKLCAAKANLLRLLDRFDEAVTVCRAALRRGARSPDLSRAYAQALHLAGEDEAAFAALDEAAALQPALAWWEKAVLLGALGRLSESCDAFDRALSVAPALAGAWHDKANAKAFRSGDPDIAAMSALLEAGCAHRDRMLLHFALGKARFESGSIDLAFAHWHEGNRMKRASIEYNAEAAAQGLQSIAAVPMDPPAGPARGARASEMPVFVVGMPRCGSSLIEQILASHPDIHGGGEQMRLRESFDSFLDRPERADEERAAESVLRVLERRGAHKARVIDKDLMNFKYLGVIHRIFPHARIIHCRRDAMDTCFSAYAKLFVGNFPFTYDLRELGLYHRAYDSLMRHWSRVLPPENLLTIDYETLVSKPEETMRGLLDFLRLPWHEGCLRFFETDRSIDTASLAQVRRPIYGSSVGRAAAVHAHLRVLEAALGEPG